MFQIQDDGRWARGGRVRRVCLSALARWGLWIPHLGARSCEQDRTTHLMRPVRVEIFAFVSLKMIPKMFVFIVLREKMRKKRGRGIVQPCCTDRWAAGICP